ncbi:MAG: DUF1214 domain-containing protein [Dermatophilaceae bacterium]
MATRVSVDDFARAETARMFHDLQRDAGGVNTFRHNREPAPVDDQTVIRMNRDTLYSFAVVDLRAGATLEVPEADARYLSVMVVDEDHHVVAVWHDPGTYRLDEESVGSAYAFLAVRILVDASDPADVAEVARLQDRLVLTAASAESFAAPDLDQASLDETRNALLVLASGLVGFDRMFGTRDHVDPVRHLIGTAAGWGGLPTSEAAYMGVDPRLPPGEYEMTFRDVPVDAFWSVSVYNAAGFFEPNPAGRYTVNSVMAQRDPDGPVTVRFTADREDTTTPNAIPVPEGWNVLIRLYRPRPEVLTGVWTLPPLVPVGNAGG